MRYSNIENISIFEGSASSCLSVFLVILTKLCANFVVSISLNVEFASNFDIRLHSTIK